MITDDEIKALYDRNSMLIVLNKKLQQENANLEQRIHDICMELKNFRESILTNFNEISKHFTLDDFKED